jgi:YidC/Oxa1 family membrane protein insertase
MDKNTITAFVLMALLIAGFSYVSRPSQEQLDAQKRYYDSIALVQQQEQEALEAKTAAALAGENGEVEADSTSMFFSATRGTNANPTISNDLLEVKKSRTTTARMAHRLFCLTAVTLQ